VKVAHLPRNQDEALDPALFERRLLEDDKPVSALDLDEIADRGLGASAIEDLVGNLWPPQNDFEGGHGRDHLSVGGAARSRRVSRTSVRLDALHLQTRGEWLGWPSAGRLYQGSP